MRWGIPWHITNMELREVLLPSLQKRHVSQTIRNGKLEAPMQHEARPSGARPKGEWWQ